MTFRRGPTLRPEKPMTGTCALGLPRDGGTDVYGPNRYVQERLAGLWAMMRS